MLPMLAAVIVILDRHYGVGVESYLDTLGALYAIHTWLGGDGPDRR